MIISYSFLLTGISSVPFEWIDPSKEKLQNPDLYYLWLYGKDLIPGSKDFTYYVNTHQEYLLRSLNDKPFFKDLMSKFPGLRDLYLDAMRRLE